MTYAQTLDFLFSSLPEFQNIGAAAYKPGLERTQELLTALGDPHTKFQTIHIAGTNGKGSTSHIIAAILQKAGYRTGLYTSPHLKDFRERIKIDGQMISETEVVDFVAQNDGVLDRLSFFEMTVGMAFAHFARYKVDVAVVETGLGGRLDSTNVITPLISIITNIGLDHTALLGNTLPKIAFEKAGIIKPNIPVVIGESNPETDNVFIAKACACSAKIVFADRTLKAEAHDSSLHETTDCGNKICDNKDNCQKFTITNISSETGETSGTSGTNKPTNSAINFEISLDLLGNYQQKNMATALTAISLLPQLKISPQSITEGCRTAAAATGLIGRWQVLDNAPLTVCDTGHNAHGLEYVVQQINAQTFENLYIVFGVVSDKDLTSVLPLMPQRAHYIFTQAAISRAMPAQILSQQAAKFNLRGEIIPNVAQAYARAKKLATSNDMIFIGGSTFTISEIY